MTAKAEMAPLLLMVTGTHLTTNSFNPGNHRIRALLVLKLAHAGVVVLGKHEIGTAESLDCRT